MSPTSDPRTPSTRVRILAQLQAWRRAATTDELAAELGLHPNGVRVHLDGLRRAGLVDRRRVRHGAGRPRDHWTIDPQAAPDPRDPAPYAELGRWLTRVVRAGAAGAPDVAAIGRTIGRELAPMPSDAPPEQQLHDALAAMRFRPREVDGPPGEWGCRLDHCPYRNVAEGSDRLVCRLHRGITEGLLDVIAPGSALRTFVPHDPADAGCEVTVAIATADDG